MDKIEMNKITLDPEILEYACMTVHVSWAHWGEATRTGYRSFIARAMIAYMTRVAELSRIEDVGAAGA